MDPTKAKAILAKLCCFNMQSQIPVTDLENCPASSAVKKLPSAALTWSYLVMLMYRSCFKGQYNAVPVSFQSSVQKIPESFWIGKKDRPFNSKRKEHTSYI